MNRTTRGALVLAATCAVTLAVGSSLAVAKPGNGHGGGGGAGRPGAGKGVMVNTLVDADAAGKMDVKHFPARGDRAERSWMRFKLRHLDAATTYALWMDDPATDLDPALVLVADVTITTNDGGNLNFRIDTKKGATLPFGSTLALLGGKAFELRNASDVAVLTGTVPAVQ